MVEDDGVEVSTVVVGNEVLGGVGALQAARSDALVLQQRLVQGEQHLQGEGEEEGGRGSGWEEGSLCTSTFSLSGGIQHEAREEKKCEHRQSSPFKEKGKKGGKL